MGSTPDVQRFVDQLSERRLSPSTIRNALLPLRALSRRALIRGDITGNPTHGLELPAQRGRRDRIATPREAETLLAALPLGDRPVWATAMYAGLRLGELQALKRDAVDLERHLLHVRHSWDRRAGPVAPKSRAGIRTVPLVARLRAELEPLEDRSGDGLVFGRTADRPFSASGLVSRATRLWRAAGIEPITPHECRHTYASFMIAAGVNVKALSILGHASITITLDL